jgi:hypothetical protein
MKRKCLRCQKDLTPDELSREETKGMEAERKAKGLEGVLFRYYTCSACGNGCIFVDIHPLEGESDEAFNRRRDELDAAISQVHANDGVEAVLVDK